MSSSVEMAGTNLTGMTTRERRRLPDQSAGGAITQTQNWIHKRVRIWFVSHGGVVSLHWEVSEEPGISTRRGVHRPAKDRGDAALSFQFQRDNARATACGHHMPGK